MCLEVCLAMTFCLSFHLLKAGESDLGGLKEWNTDMALDADFILDDEAQRLADEAKKNSVCVPIGEGENCW